MTQIKPNVARFRARFAALLVVAASSVSMMMVHTDAEAKRMGGGSSFGKTAPSYSRSATPTQPAAPTGTAPAKQATSPTAANQPAQAPAAKPASRWAGPLMGLAAGLGIAALFSALGLGEGLASFVTMLLIGLVAFMVIRMVMRAMASRQGAQPMPAGAGAGGLGSARAPYDQGNTYKQAEPVTARQTLDGFGQPSAAAGSAWSGYDQAPVASATMVKDLPSGFDEQQFVVSAKKFFVTMQGMFDRADIDGLRDYCSDEVLEHLRMQIADFPVVGNHTEVVTLNAELIGFETDVDEQLATVAFSGQIRESEGGAASDLNEIWVMSRPASGGGWVLAGIQNL